VSKYCRSTGEEIDGIIYYIPKVEDHATETRKVPLRKCSLTSSKKMLPYQSNALISKSGF